MFNALPYLKYQDYIKILTNNILIIILKLIYLYCKYKQDKYLNIDKHNNINKSYTVVLN